MKFILHCNNLDNLMLFARAAKYCAEADLTEGKWGVLSYSTEPETRISYMKRKTCVTLWDQP